MIAGESYVKDRVIVPAALHAVKTIARIPSWPGRAIERTAVLDLQSVTRAAVGPILLAPVKT